MAAFEVIIEDTMGSQASDNLNIIPWVYDHSTKTTKRLNTTDLEKQIDRYLKTKQFRSGLYYLPPIGWESITGRRVVFAALPSPGEDAKLGIWSMDMNGQRPKILATEYDKYVPLRFGKPTPDPRQ